MSDGPKQNPVTSMKNATLLTAAIFAPGRIEFVSSASGVAGAAEIDREARAAVNTLYASNLTAQLVGKKQVYGGTRSTVMRPAGQWQDCPGTPANPALTPVFNLKSEGKSLQLPNQNDCTLDRFCTI